MRATATGLACVVTFALTSLSASAEAVTLKLGTLAPQGSTWHLLLKDLAERFATASGGEVKLKIYAGGTQGAESDMVRKMGVGQLQAALLSNVGLHDVAPEPILFSAPGMLDPGLVATLLPQVAARMERSLEARGYVVLQWVQVGTAYVFCTRPYRTPEEAAEGKFFAWDGDPGTVAAFQAIGLRPVVLSATDLVPSLQTGMITCVTQAPAYVLATRLFEKASAMVDFPFSYLIGATVVKKESWEKVAPGLRPRLLAIARERAAALNLEIKKLNQDALEAMQAQGLTVVKADTAAWQAGAERAWPVVRGKLVPADFFDDFLALRAAALKAR
jgi:TRAP-type C4-dicarboxylate transport system substrate-binding protein